MGIVKKITALSLAMVIMVINLAGCGSYNTEDILGDENGNQIKFVSYNDDGSIDWISEYEYNENGETIYESYENDCSVM